MSYTLGDCFLLFGEYLQSCMLSYFIADRRLALSLVLPTKSTITALLRILVTGINVLKFKIASPTLVLRS